jgi:hypothetical protein
MLDRLRLALSFLCHRLPVTTTGHQPFLIVGGRRSTAERVYLSSDPSIPSQAVRVQNRQSIGGVPPRTTDRHVWRFRLGHIREHERTDEDTGEARAKNAAVVPHHRINQASFGRATRSRTPHQRGLRPLVHGKRDGLPPQQGDERSAPDISRVPRCSSTKWRAAASSSRRAISIHPMPSTRLQCQSRHWRTARC